MSRGVSSTISIRASPVTYIQHMENFVIIIKITIIPIIIITITIPIIIIAFLVLESPHPAAVRRSHQPFRIWFQLLSISAGLPNLLTYLIEPPGFTHLTNLTDLPYPLNQTQTKQTRQFTQFKLFWHRVVSQCYVCVWGWILLAPVFLFSSGLPSHPPRSPPPVCCFQKQVLECTSPWLGMRKMYQIMDVIKKLLFPTFL